MWDEFSYVDSPRDFPRLYTEGDFTSKEVILKAFSNFIQLVTMLCILQKRNNKIGVTVLVLHNMDGLYSNFATDEAGIT